MRRLFRRRLGPRLGHHVVSAIASRVFLLFLVLCVTGYFVGRHSLPDASEIPYDQLLENLGVYSWRDAPADSTAHFAVELTVNDRVFRVYDVDHRRFESPAAGHGYRRSISGTHYAPLRLRGRADTGFWLVLADSGGRIALPGQFEELYRKSLAYVKPVSIVSNVLGLLSGYSVGFRLATWNTSLANPAVQERVVETPGMGRTITREAWRRVLLEPAVIADEEDPGAFATAYDAQRLYGNFFKLAVRDSDGFIPREAARLAASGHPEVGRAMLAFAAAVARANPDSDLTSADFRAVENWAALLDREGHWAKFLTPARGEERAQYLGVLAWYGLAPPGGAEPRVWIEPRMLVRDGDTEGFVADGIAATETGCPLLWRACLLDGTDRDGVSAWTAQWTAGRPELVPFVTAGRKVAHLFHAGH